MSGSGKSLSTQGHEYAYVVLPARCIAVFQSVGIAEFERVDFTQRGAGWKPCDPPDWNEETFVSTALNDYSNLNFPHWVRVGAAIRRGRGHDHFDPRERRPFRFRTGHDITSSTTARKVASGKGLAMNASAPSWRAWLRRPRFLQPVDMITRAPGCAFLNTAMKPRPLSFPGWAKSVMTRLNLCRLAILSACSLVAASKTRKPGRSSR